MKKMNNKKGFTLAELLIVIAIIGVLIAIAMPTFRGQLDKAKVATEEANARATYAEAVSKYLTDGSTTDFPKTIAGITYTAKTTDNGDTWSVTLSKSEGGGPTKYNFSDGTTGT